MDKNAGGLEAKAAQLFQRGLYKEALQTYSACLESLTRSPKQDLKSKVNLVFNRSACYLKLKQFQSVVEDCNLILHVDPKNDKAQGRKIKALCSLGNFAAAQYFANQWIQSDPVNPQARKEWERLNIIVKALKEQEDEDSGLCGPTEKLSPQHKLSPQAVRMLAANAHAQRAQVGFNWTQPNAAPAPPNNPWQITNDKRTGKDEYDIAWGRASNTTWEGLTDDNSSLDFPGLRKGGSSLGAPGCSGSLTSTTQAQTTVTQATSSASQEFTGSFSLIKNLEFGKNAFPPNVSAGNVFQELKQEEQTPQQTVPLWGRGSIEGPKTAWQVSEERTSEGARADINTKSEPTWPVTTVKSEPPTSDTNTLGEHMTSVRVKSEPGVNHHAPINSQSSWPGLGVIKSEPLSTPPSVTPSSAPVHSQGPFPWGPTSFPSLTPSQTNQSMGPTHPNSQPFQAGLGFGQSNGKVADPLEAALRMPLDNVIGGSQSSAMVGQSRFSLYKNLVESSNDGSNAGSKTDDSDSMGGDMPSPKCVVTSTESNAQSTTSLANKSHLHGTPTNGACINSQSTMTNSNRGFLNSSSKNQNGDSELRRIGQSFIPHVIQNKILTSRSNSLTEQNTHQQQQQQQQNTQEQPVKEPKSAVISSHHSVFAFKPKPLDSREESTMSGAGGSGSSGELRKLNSGSHGYPMEESHVTSGENGSQSQEVSREKGPQNTSVDSEEKGASSSETKWNHRQPPRGVTSQEYSLCPRFRKIGHCPFGDNCWQAHCEEELQEWKERFEERKQALQKQRESETEGATYAQKLIERLLRVDDTTAVMVEELEGVHIHVNSALRVTMTSKKSAQTWTFTVTSKMSVKRVCLLDDTNRKQFHIAAITTGPKKSQRNQRVRDHCQEWMYPDFTTEKASADKIFRIKVQFKTEIFGTFRQTVIFDFGSEPVIQRELCVDSSPVTDIEKLTKDLIISETGRWDVAKMQVVEFQPKRFQLEEEEKEMLENYPAPSATTFAEAALSLAEPALTRDNYRMRMHSLLYIEEMAQFSSIAKYNVTIPLQLTKSFMLTPATTSTAKFAQSGELFARITLHADISEDTSHGRLILQNVYTVFLAPAPRESDGVHKGEKKADSGKSADNSGKDVKEENGQDKAEELPDKVYEALIEEKGKNFIFLRLSAQCTKELGLRADMEFKAQVQFQLNRMPLAEMHLALDKLPEIGLVFPTLTKPTIPWTPGRQWQDTLDTRLNAKQKEALVAITTDQEQMLPPVLLVGPYGTGKTFTLAQAAKQILKQENTRVLICAHSNSAADLYIREYLHPYVASGHPEATPLRVYYRQRWVQTVGSVILQYCLIRVDRVHGTVFVSPTKEDVERHRVVVCTLATCRSLYNIGLKKGNGPREYDTKMLYSSILRHAAVKIRARTRKGHFTHILLDEAAQALECETIMPLVLADSTTRLVLAGDHMQLSPEVHSDFARERSLDLSFLERLFEVYPHDFPCKILLCENYRSHKAIIELTSELFYDKQLVSSGQQPAHGRLYPLTFYTAQGQDTQHHNSTGFYNNAEVYEIVERVLELTKSWPKAWGELDNTSIGVLAPYADQVVRIRAELRKKKLSYVSVERVLNVQGKQFRAVLLSTVRTRHTCSSDAAQEDMFDYGFLSNVKLLNTAVTRAQSLLAVVGDPVSLCSIGKCRKLWERFLELCNEHDSLNGMGWAHLRSQLDGVELKKTYILNPLAPEFIPNRLRHACYEPPEPIAYGKYGYAFAQHPQPPPPMYQPGRPAPFLPPQQIPPFLPPNAHMYYQNMMQPQVGCVPGAGYNVAPQYPRFVPPPLGQPGASYNSLRMFGPRRGAARTETSERSQAEGGAEPTAEGNASVTGSVAGATTVTPATATGVPLMATMKAGAGMDRLRVMPSGQPQLVRPPPMSYSPRLLYQPGYPPVQVPGYKLPGYPAHLLQHPQMVNALNQQRLMAQPPPPPQTMVNPQGLLMQQASLSPSQMIMREHRSTSMRSPNRGASPSSARGGSASPARQPPPTSKVEFLPKAVNVKTPPLSKASAQQQLPQQSAAAHSQSYAPMQMPPPPQQQFMNVSPMAANSFLQRELYRYIVQREGQLAADRFVQQSLQRDQLLLQQAQRHHHHQQQQQQQAQQEQLLVRQTALNASDLERQWQEESVLRGGSGSAVSMVPPAAYQHTQPLFINPNLQNLTQDVTTRRQSPFGDGPQPYSKLNEEQKQEWKQQIASGSSSAVTPEVSAVDSPQASPGGTRSKVPLYMRRVGQTNPETGSAPRLSYASAVRTNPPPANIEDIPERTPQTVGPFTPENHPFVLCRFQPTSADSTASSIGPDPLEILKNLKMQESPKSGISHPLFPSP